MKKEQKEEEIYRLQLLYLYQQAQNQVQHENQNPNENADFQHDGHPDDKIQTNSSFFSSWERPEDPVLQIGQKYQNLKPPSKYEIFFLTKAC